MQTQLNNQNEKKYQRIMKILNRIRIILNLCEMFYLIVGWLWGKAVRTSQGQLLEMQLLESRLLNTFFENVNCSTEKS